VKCLAVLLRFYPQALLDLVQHKVTVLLHREKTAA
jgi:hypothetical protein